MRNNRLGLWIILTTVFLNFLSYGIIIPFLPFYAEKFGGGGFAVGLLFAAYALSQFIFTPFIGRLSDRVGRRPIIILSLFGEALSLLALIFAFAYWWLLLARIFGGIFGSITGVAQAYLSDITPAEKKTKIMGYFGAAFGTGFIAGPALGSYFSGATLNFPGCLLIEGYKFCLSDYAPQSDFFAPFLVASVISFIASIVAYFFLKESLTPESLVAEKKRETFFQGFSYVFRHKLILLWIAFYFIGIFNFSNIETIFAIFTKFKFGLSPKEIGYFFIYVGFLVALIQVIGISFLVRYLKDIQILLIGGFLSGLSYVILPFAPSVPYYFFFLAIFAFGVGLSSPAILGIISKLSHREDYGVVLGVTQSSARIAQVVGSFWAGFSYQYISPASPMLSAGIVMFCAFLILFILWLKKYDFGA